MGNSLDLDRREFHMEAAGQRICAQKGCRNTWPWHPHHVVYEQHCPEGTKSDTRNCLRLCPDCHANHHGRARPILLTQLRDANYEFAFEVLGDAAYDYLRTRYDGDDPRLEELRERTTDV